MKKNNCEIIIDGNRAIGKLWLFLPLFGYTESDSRKSAQNGHKSDPIVSFACHHFIAKWGWPQNLKKIGEVWNEPYITRFLSLQLIKITIADLKIYSSRIFKWTRKYILFKIDNKIIYTGSTEKSSEVHPSH